MHPNSFVLRTALVCVLIVIGPTVAFGQAEGTAGERASQPAAARSQIDQLVEVEGTLEVLYEDYTWGARVRHFLHAEGKRLSLDFAAQPPGLLTGQRVRARGVRVGDALALDSGSASVQTVGALALANTFGEQRTLVLLVNFQDNPAQPYTLAYAHDVVFMTTSDFDREASFQQTWLTGDTFGWFTIGMSSAVCDVDTLASLADRAAAAAGVNLSLYSRRVYAFPQNACAWWGLGTVGGSPSRAWINGTLNLRVAAHEMGHNFGLYHAHAQDCGASVITPPCTTSEYGDTLDMMGGDAVHFNAFMKERLGWLAYGSQPPITTVQSDGTYFIEPFESAPGGASKALKILKSTDPTTGAKIWYYVELRQGVGFDSGLGTNSNVLTGVLVRTASDSSGNTSYLLDMTPETTSWSDPALIVGKTFTDTVAGVTITTVSADSTGATVAVSVPAPAPAPVPTITVQVSTDRTGYTRNQTVSTKARVSAGSSPAAGAAVTFTITKSNGSVVTAAATADASGVGTCSLRLTKKDPTGVYQVTASASAGGASGSGTVSFSVK